MSVDHQEDDAVGRGKELHREFVGMLFSLAIAQVAIQASEAVNSGAGWRECLATYSHLTLAACLIATSWVGWGWSGSSLSDISTVFSRNFLELSVDLLLVGVYFFITMGAELPDETTKVVTPSLSEEAKWIPVVFGLYLAWDILTKIFDVAPKDRFPDDRWKDRIHHFFQRAWGTMACFLLALAACWCFKSKSGALAKNVLTGDGALLSLIFLFRALKAKDFSDMENRDWRLSGGLLLALIALVAAAIWL